MMKRLIASFAIVAALGGSAHAVDAGLARSIVADAAGNYVQPGYWDLAEAAAGMRKRVEALCARPSQNGLDAARRQFSDAVDAWSAIEMIRFGPVTENNRLERILYWPDRRSIGLKQVQGILAEKDPSATVPDTLEQKSVAVQGFGALEFVLFGTGSEALAAGDAYRCAFGNAIAVNLERRAREVEDAWTTPGGFLKTWTEPGAGNPLYRDEQEALGEVIDALIHGLEMVRDVRLNGFLGETAEDDKPRGALFWRSGKTIATLKYNLGSLARLFEVSGLARTLPNDAEWIASSVAFEFDNARNALAPLAGMPIDKVLADPQMRGKLAYVRLVTSSLSDIVGRHLTGALGLTAGFSSLDGD